MSGDGYRVGVLGATGLVGTTILELLAARDFPIAELRPLASARSAGKEIEWDGRALTVQELGEETIAGLDLVLSSAGGSVSAEWTPKLVAAGATVVDNTSYWRMTTTCRWSSPRSTRRRSRVTGGSSPTPTARPCRWSSRSSRSSTRPGSSAWSSPPTRRSRGPARRRSTACSRSPTPILHGEEARPTVYPHPIAFNVLAQAGSFAAGDDHTDEERKLINETRKILGDDSIRVSATCVRVPVITGHSEAVNVETSEPLDPDRARELLAAAPGVKVVDDPGASRFPMAIEAAGPGRGPRRPHPPRPRQRARARPLDRRRQPAQGRGDQRRAGRGAAGRARPARAPGVDGVDISFGAALLLFGAPAGASSPRSRG